MERTIDLIKSRKFTYGFEMEGAFLTTFLDELYQSKRKLRISKFETKTDGSVDVERLPSGIKSSAIDDRYQELAIGIFNDFNRMLKVIKLFKNDKNFFQNSSCGLHIHIAPKSTEYRDKICDLDFIRKLQEWSAENLCSHVRSRLRDNHYCEPYSLKDKWGFNESYSSFKSGNKYKFIHNHHTYKTFEFRFFSTCKHKEENVEKFFKFFFDTLAIKTRKKGIGLGFRKSRTKKLTIDIMPDNTSPIKKLEIVLPLFVRGGKELLRKDYLGEIVIYTSGNHGQGSNNPLWNGDYGYKLGKVISILSSGNLNVMWCNGMLNAYDKKDLRIVSQDLNKLTELSRAELELQLSYLSDLTVNRTSNINYEERYNINPDPLVLPDYLTTPRTRRETPAEIGRRQLRERIDRNERARARFRTVRDLHDLEPSEPEPLEWVIR